MNYKEIERMLLEKFRTQNKVAQNLGVSSTGFRQTIDNHTMDVKMLEKISFILKKPVSYFFDENTTQNAEEPMPPYTKKSDWEEEKRILYRQIESLLDDKKLLLKEISRLRQEGDPHYLEKPEGGMEKPGKTG